MNDHVLKNAKAYVALAGSLASALLGVFTADTPVGKALTVVSVLTTAFGTWYVENASTPSIADLLADPLATAEDVQELDS